MWEIFGLCLVAGFAAAAVVIWAKPPALVGPTQVVMEVTMGMSCLEAHLQVNPKRLPV